MNILALNKMGDIDTHVNSFASRLHHGLGGNLLALNVVSVPGEIPLKQNGQVLDFCTEFDLSGYAKKAVENEAIMQDAYKDIDNSEVKSLVGNPHRIIRHQAAVNNTDLIISGAHETTVFEDVFTHSFVHELMDTSGKPLLSLKCDRSDMVMDKIMIVGEFAQAVKENLSVIKSLIKAFDLELILARINTPKKHGEKDEIIQEMTSYVNINKIEAKNVEFIISEAESAFDGVQSLINKHNPCISAFKQHSKNDQYSMLNGQLEANILNHVAAPILIY